NSENPFGPAQLATLRAEIEAQGLLADRFLGNDADAPTFGLNLACAWPFPDEWRESYERMARRFAAIGPWLYVYPFEFTHVTLVTSPSFSRHVRPAPGLVKTPEGKAGEILETLAPLFAEAGSPGSAGVPPASSVSSPPTRRRDASAPGKD